MGFFGMLFWVVVLWFVYRAWKRSERYVPVGPKRRLVGMVLQGSLCTTRPAGSRARADYRLDYIDSLESRISERSAWISPSVSWPTDGKRVRE